jgi:hypothetical protein
MSQAFGLARKETLAWGARQKPFLNPPFASVKNSHP